MCASCFSHLLADARLKDETSTCPNCRCEINKSSCSRNLAVEKAISELPTECQYCSRQLPRSAIQRHERELCQERCVALTCLVRLKQLHPCLPTLCFNSDTSGLSPTFLLIGSWMMNHIRFSCVAYLTALIAATGWSPARVLIGYKPQSDHHREVVGT